MVIGIDQYKSWPRLGNAVNDATGFARELKGKLGFQEAAPPLLNQDATRQAIAARPNLKLIGLSASGDDRMVVEMLRAGAVGHVNKTAAASELITAIRTVLKGSFYFSPDIVARIAADNGEHAHSAFDRLSPREREVLQLISEGKATKEVAAMLRVSIKTAETHRRNLMDKLHVDSVAELTKYAIREGLTSA